MRFNLVIAQRIKMVAKNKDDVYKSYLIKLHISIRSCIVYSFLLPKCKWEG